MADEAEWFEARGAAYANDPEYILYGLLYKATDDICRAMEAQGLSRAQLASRAGMSARQFRRFLQTPENTQLRTIVRVATELGLKVELRISEED